ncbi:hypothetical protein SLA2020_260640 [Shorea laevis]
MSPGVCQGLQSCLEPRLNEPRVSWLKSATLIATFSASIDASPAAAGNQSNNAFNTTVIAAGNVHHTKNTQNADTGGWSFLQSLTNTTKDSTMSDTVYVHPTVKRSASMLSNKSLEMCTESLGSETGSNVSDISNEIPLLSPETATSSPSKPRQNSKWMHRSSSFPPPLPSISSSGGVQMRSYREGGRFVLQAVPLPPPYFHAERSEGRLRLCLFKDSPVTENDEEEEVIGEEEEEEEEVVEEEEEVEAEEEEGYWAEDTEENNGNGGDEIGMGKFPRPGGCKEGGRGHRSILNWESFCVAT